MARLIGVVVTPGEIAPSAVFVVVLDICKNRSIH